MRLSGRRGLFVPVFLLRMVAAVAALQFCASAAGAAIGGSDALSLRGEIDPGLIYSVRIAYVAGSHESACQQSSFITGTIVQREKPVTYHPEIGAGHHRLSAPLTLDDEDRCGWRASAVYICLSGGAEPASDAQGCTELFIRNGDAAAAAGTISLACAASCESSSTPLPRPISRGGDVILNLRLARK